MGTWTFYDFVEASGRNPFNEWLRKLPESAQAVIDARILQMMGLGRWPEKWVSRYEGADKLYELRISYNKVQYRPLGIYAPKYSFILLGGAKEKGGQLPKGVLSAVQVRQKAHKAGQGHVREHRFD